MAEMNIRWITGLRGMAPGCEVSERFLARWKAARFAACLVLAGFLTGTMGCRTTDPEIPKTDSLAAVIVRGADAQDIREVARDVFREDQFMQAITNATLLTFEKRGSLMNDIAYGSFLNNESWVRVKLNILPMEEEKHLVECRVFMVRNYGESFFEEESKIRRMKRNHYQELLDRIRDRVEGPAAPGDSSL